MWATIETAFKGGVILGVMFFAGASAAGLVLALFGEAIGVIGYDIDLESPIAIAFYIVAGLMVQGHIVMSRDWLKP